MHVPYEQRINHRADFRVKYKFRSPENGGRPSGPPFQGIRSDFSFPGDKENQQYMIHPEFEDENGEVILDKSKPVPKSGTARMWILDDRMRPFHYDKVKVGVTCFFREGRYFTADCEVIEIIDLLTNPTIGK